MTSNHQVFNSRFAIALVTLAFLSRVLPHTWNFTAMGAVSLALGYLVPKTWQRLALISLTLFASDLFLGLELSPISSYLCYFIATIFGQKLPMVSFSTERLPDAVKKMGRVFLPLSIGSSAVFYFISNFFVWLEGGLYPRTFFGLLECYWLAVPFALTQVTSDIFFGCSILTAYLWVHGRAFAQNMRPN